MQKDSKANPDLLPQGIDFALSFVLLIPLLSLHNPIPAKDDATIWSEDLFEDDGHAHIFIIKSVRTLETFENAPGFDHCATAASSTAPRGSSPAFVPRPAQSARGRMPEPGRGGSHIIICSHVHTRQCAPCHKIPSPAPTFYACTTILLRVYHISRP